MKLLREPLFHFLILGAGLFALFGLVDDSEGQRTDRIVVTAGQIEWLAEGWTRTWQRPPTPAELDGLVEDHIREEVFYREALAMGLDRDDMVVRRRLRQKVEFLTDDLAAAVEPTEEELRGYLADNAEQFRIDSSFSFDHVYFNRDRRGDAAYRDAEELLSRLATASSDVDPAALGDPLLLPGEYQQASSREIGGRFGKEFAARLTELPIGRWAGPIESGYGLHLVLIRERIDGFVPDLEDVQKVVKREWMAERRKETGEAFYQGLRARYSVVVEQAENGGTGETPGVSESRR